MVNLIRKEENVHWKKTRKYIKDFNQIFKKNENGATISN